MLDYDQLAEKNLEKFNTFLKNDSRFTKLEAMYDAFGNELISAPASGRTYFHNAFPGGYLDHVIRVAEASLKVTAAYNAMGGEIDFTKQELIFAALHHDLGKLGSNDGPYYIDQDSDWHRKRGEMYKQNENIQYMTVTDRALYLLQQFEIPVTEKEWIAIKLSDGAYDEGNVRYFKNSYKYPMKTNLHLIIHWADHMASNIEKENSKF